MIKRFFKSFSLSIIQCENRLSLSIFSSLLNLLSSTSKKNISFPFEFRRSKKRKKMSSCFDRTKKKQIINACWHFIDDLNINDSSWRRINRLNSISKSLSFYWSKVSIENKSQGFPFVWLKFCRRIYPIKKSFAGNLPSADLHRQFFPIEKKIDGNFREISQRFVVAKLRVGDEHEKRCSISNFFIFEGRSQIFYLFR